MAQLWTIVQIADGKVLAAGFYTDSPGQHPKDKGWAWDPATQRATRIDKPPEQREQSWNGTAWVDDVAKLKANAIGRLKDEAEQLKMTNLTSGGAKKAEYADKAVEVREFDKVAGTLEAILLILKALPPAKVASTYPWAVAEMAEMGEPNIAPAIARFRAGATKAGRNHRIGAREQRICKAIEAASDAASIRKLADVTWPS